MFHWIISILTSTAVAFHALLGCCAHHSHASHLPEQVQGIAASDDMETQCPYHHHHHNSELSDEPADDHHGHQHHGNGKSCDEGKCGFASVLRDTDLPLMLSFAMWCQAVGDVSTAAGIDRLLSHHSAIEYPPDRLRLAGTLRAQSQVWQL